MVAGLPRAMVASLIFRTLFRCVEPVKARGEPVFDPKRPPSARRPTVTHTVPFTGEGRSATGAFPKVRLNVRATAAWLGLPLAGHLRTIAIFAITTNQVNL